MLERTEFREELYSLRVYVGSSSKLVAVTLTGMTTSVHFGSRFSTEDVDARAKRTKIAMMLLQRNLVEDI